jgi:hypothetical protein
MPLTEEERGGAFHIQKRKELRGREGAPPFQVQIVGVGGLGAAEATRRALGSALAPPKGKGGFTSFPRPTRGRGLPFQGRTGGALN